MSAPQTAWARPLGQQLVSLFRETAVWFIQPPGTTYDPLVGTVTTGIGKVWHCGGAVVRKGIGRHTEWGQGSTSFLFVNSTDVEMWFDSTTLPVEPQATDFVWYQGQEWSVTKVEPALESGMAFYAYKVVISALSQGSAQTDTPPPPGKYLGAKVESFGWLDHGTAPGQPAAGGGPQIIKLRWQVQPVGPLTMTPGVAATATQGTVTGGTAPYSYANQWFVSPDGKTGWVPVPGATGLTYTPTAADLGSFFQLHVTATDSETPPLAMPTATLVVEVKPPALVADVLPAVDPASTTVRVGVPLLGVAGTATGGTGAITYASKWQASADGKTGWIDLPADPGVPLQVTPLAAQQGWYLRFVTTATDSATPTAETLEMHSPNTASLAAVGVTGLTRVTLPTVTGNPRVGAVLTAAGAVATGGTTPITYGYRWQFAKLRRGPWVDIVGATGTTYTPTATDVGHHLRAVALATDSATPTAHTLDLPSLQTATVTGALRNTAVPTLPAAAPSAGTAFGPFTAGTWTGGAHGVTYTQHWQSSSDGGKTWTDIASATGDTYTPVASDAGHLLRVVETATDGDTPPATGDANSAPSLAVVSATTECAGGPAVVRTAAGVNGIGSLYCAPGVWTLTAGGYDPLSGSVSASGWSNPAVQSGASVPQTTDPSVKLTYGRPVGVAADWREVQRGEWHNLRTGEVWHLNAYKWDGTFTQIGDSGGGFGTGNLGVSLEPWVVGPIVAPSPLVAITVIDKPTPSTGTWTQLAPLVPGGMPRWEQTVPATGITVTQWGDPTKIGTPGLLTLLWLGTGADPWLQAGQPPAVGGVLPPRPNIWTNRETGQKWPADGSNGKPNTRPQPADTATIPRPPASIPSTTAGKPNPTYNPWVQLPRVSPVSWWNYVTKTEVHSATQPPIEQWVSPGPGRGTNASTPSGTGTWVAISDGPGGHRWRHIGTGAVVEQSLDPGLRGVDPRATIIAVGNGWAACSTPGVDICPAGPWMDGTLEVVTTWTRQTDGLQLVQGRRPNIPIDTPTDWWESPAGTWHSTLRSEIYVQAGNPGTVGNVVPFTAATPVGKPRDWVKSGTGGAGTPAGPGGVPAAVPADPIVWNRATTHQRVTQPGNPGIAGIVGAVVVLMAELAAPAAGGNLHVGQVLTMTGGTVTGGTGTVTATETWERQLAGTTTWVTIAGATGTSYTLVAGDVGAKLRVTVTHTDSATPAHTFVHSSPAVGPGLAAVVATPLAKATDPTLTGTGGVGTTLTAAVGTSTGGTGTVTHTVTLERASSAAGPWSSITNPYTVVAGDEGGAYDPLSGGFSTPSFFRATDTVTDGATPANTYTAHSAAVAAAAALVAGTPTLAGSLTVTPGTATGGTGAITTTEAWFRAATAAGPWVAIPGATGTTYATTAADLGTFIRCTVTYTDSATPAQVVTASVSQGPMGAPPPPRVRVAGVTFGVPGPWVRVGGVADPFSGAMGPPWTYTGPGGESIDQPFDIDPSTPAPVVEPLASAAAHGIGDYHDWTPVLDPTHAGRPANATSSRRWTNAVTGMVLWQIDNPAAKLPAGAKFDPVAQQYSAPPAARGGPYMALGFLWRSPDPWHWDATHLVWVNDKTGELASQQGNKDPLLNPHNAPKSGAETGPFDIDGIRYGETNSPPVIRWSQAGAGHWIKLVNGVQQGPTLNQLSDPTHMPR